MAGADEIVAALEARAAALAAFGHTALFVVDGAAVLLDATGGGVAVTQADPEAEADTVLRLSAGDARKLLAGALNPMLAYSTGRLKISGSTGVALKLAKLLDEG